MYNILIIEDDINLANNISDKLEKSGFVPHLLDEYGNLEKQIYDISPNLILLDINLGNYNGIEICMKLRKITNIPILFLTGRDSIEDEIKGLSIGGNDYIKKPFSTDILIARIKRQLENQSMDNRKTLVYKNISLEVDKRIVINTKTDEELELPTVEFQILFYLMTHSETLVKREELMDYLWENRNYIDPNALNVNLSRLRKSLNGITAGDLIESIRGKGLKLC